MTTAIASEVCAGIMINIISIGLISLSLSWEVNKNINLKKNEIEKLHINSRYTIEEINVESDIE